MKARQFFLVILVAGLVLVLKWAVAAQGPEEKRPTIAPVQLENGMVPYAVIHIEIFVG